MADSLIHALTDSGHVRIATCTTSHLVQEACRLQGTSITAGVALGRVLTAAALLGGQLKEEQRLSLKFEGNGPLQKILAETDAYGNICGYVGHAEAEVPSRDDGVDLASALGKAGFLTVTKDLKLKTPYQGRVQLQSSEISQDVAYYLSASEQTPAAFGVSVTLDEKGFPAAAGGFMCQALPPVADSLIEPLEQQIQQLPPLSHLLQQGIAAEELLARIAGDIGYHINHTRPLQWQCRCSRQRMQQALISLGATELRQLSQEQELVRITCEFCGRNYAFNRCELDELAQAAEAASTSS